MNIFLTEAQELTISKDFQAEAKLALAFTLKLAKLVFLVLVGLSLLAYTTGIRVRRLVFKYLTESRQADVINLVNNSKTKLVNKVYVVPTQINTNFKNCQNQFNKLLVLYIQPVLNPILSFLKGLTHAANK